MNEILQLKGRFEQKDFGNKPGPSNIPKDKFVSIEHLINLKKDLSKVSAFWEKEKLLIKPLVSAYYTDVVAKSNRIKGMLESGSTKNNNSVVGAKFSSGESKKHIITHCVNQKTIIDSMSNIETVVSIILEIE